MDLHVRICDGLYFGTTGMLGEIEYVAVSETESDEKSYLLVHAFKCKTENRLLYGIK